MMNGKWIDSMVEMTGKYVSLETTDGVAREGRLSTLQSRALTLNGKVVQLPIAIELNGDPYDVIPFERIAKMEKV